VEEKPSAIGATRRMARVNLIAAGLSSLRRRKRADMLYRKRGIWSGSGSDVQLPSIAAFGFVAFLLVFVHPGSQQAATRQAPAGDALVTANVAAAMMPSRLQHRNDCICAIVEIHSVRPAGGVS
jgi:hypothetical protein